MKTVKAKELQAGDTITIDIYGTQATATKIEVGEYYVWSEWDDGLNIEIDPNQEFDVLD